MTRFSASSYNLLSIRCVLILQTNMASYGVKKKRITRKKGKEEGKPSDGSTTIGSLSSEKPWMKARYFKSNTKNIKVLVRARFLITAEELPDKSAYHPQYL